MWSTIRKVGDNYEYEDANGKRTATGEEIAEYHKAKIDHLLSDED